jgi:hypothetical protein
MQRRFHHIEKLRDILGDVANEVSTRECNEGGAAAGRWTELRDAKLTHGRTEIVKCHSDYRLDVRERDVRKAFRLPIPRLFLS